MCARLRAHQVPACTPAALVLTIRTGCDGVRVGKKRQRRERGGEYHRGPLSQSLTYLFTCLLYHDEEPRAASS